MECVFLIYYYRDEEDSWDFIGFTDSEEDAARVCAEHNTSDGDEEWRFVAVPKESYIPDIEVIFIEHIFFEKKNGVWNMLDTPDAFDFTKVYKEYNSIPSPRIYFPYTHNENMIYCDVVQRERNRKHAEKVAKDMLKEFVSSKDTSTIDSDLVE